jgi:hypothetical protein
MNLNLMLLAKKLARAADAECKRHEAEVDSSAAGQTEAVLGRWAATEWMAHHATIEEIKSIVWYLEAQHRVSGIRLDDVLPSPHRKKPSAYQSAFAETVREIYWDL